MQELYEKYVSKMINYVLEGDLGRGDTDGAVEEPLQLVIPISNLGLLKQLTVLLDATLTAETEYDDFDTLEGHFIFALTWSVGAAVVGKDRPRFNAFLQVRVFKMYSFLCSNARLGGTFPHADCR